MKSVAKTCKRHYSTNSWLRGLDGFDLFCNFVLRKKTYSTYLYDYIWSYWKKCYWIKPIPHYACYLIPNSHNQCCNQDKAPRTHLVVIWPRRNRWYHLNDHMTNYIQYFPSHVQKEYWFSNLIVALYFNVLHVHPKYIHENCKPCVIRFLEL